MGKKRLARYGNIEPIRGELGQKEALRRLAMYLKPLWPHLALGLFFTLLWSGSNFGYGALAKVFLDTIQKMAGQHKMQKLNELTALAFLLFTVRGALYFCYSYAWAYAAQRLSKTLRDEVFAHLQELHISFFDNRKTGQLMSAISNDIPAINAVLSAMQDSISAPFLVTVGTAILFWLNWPLALISSICLPPIAYVIVRATKRMRSYAGQLQHSLAYITEHAEETIAGIRVVKAFGNEEYEAARFRDRSQAVLRSVLRTMRVRFVMSPLVELLGAIAIILVLWVAGNQIINDPKSKLTFGTLVFFVVVLRQVADGARNLGNISVNLSQAAVAADRVFTLLDVKNDIAEKREAIELSRLEGQVRFENVSFAYSPGIPVLAGISFTMEPGEVVALVGPTGAGKTSIAALIPRFYDVSGGAIKVDGVDVRDCTIKSLRDQIGIVPQETTLFAGTLRENIAYGRLGAREEEIIAAAKLANAWEFIEKLADGLDTVIGERGTRLSGGQRQRIAIARAVLRDPRILILDEATSSLDTQSEALVQDALRKVTQHRTTLVIAHRLSTIRNANKILVIKDGQIAEAGRHEELLVRGGLYSDLYHTQFRWEATEPRGLEP
ncbi:MAG TPA: ABC transporter ATP-binding protein [Armatimonadota bacterium]|nr:ABC transporter ATP-binding protein [Armatimonadota bacterium]